MKAMGFRTLTDILMYGTMCFLAGTGLLLHFRLVPGFMGGQGLTMLGLSRHEWGTCHFWAACFLLALVLVHMAFNFAFIKNRIAARRTWLVIVLGLAGLLITFFFLFFPVVRSGEEGHGRGLRKRGGQSGQVEAAGRGAVRD